MTLDRIFMNGIYPELFTRRRGARSLREQLEHDASGNGDRLGVALRRAALRAAVSEHRRATRAPRAAERLRGGVRAGRRSSCRSCSAPQLDMEAVEELADAIEEGQL